MSGKKFRFSLQSVLDLREYKTEQARHALQAAVNERQQQEQAVERARQRLDELRTRAPDPGRIDCRTLRQYDAFCRHARQTLEAQREKLDALKQNEEEARTRWIQTRQAEESLQNLHDQEETQHRKDQSAAELDFIDEQSVMRYNRNSSRTSLL